MHDTLIENIKGFLDELSFKDTSIYIKGWAFHNEMPLIQLRVSGKSHTELVDLYERQDVNQYYNKFTAISISTYYFAGNRAAANRSRFCI